MIPFRVRAAAAVALTAGSCAAPPAAVHEGMSAAELAGLVGARHQALRTMVGSGTVAFRGPEGGGTGAFSMAFRRPDSLLVRVEGPFGIDIGTLFLSTHSYVFYNSLENVAYTGNPGDATMQSMLPVAMTPGEIMNAFTGSPDLPPGASEGVLTFTGDGPVLVCEDRAGSGTYRVDPALGVVARFERRNVDDAIVVAAEFADFREEGDAVVPAAVSITLPSRDTSLRVRYRRLSVNGEEPAFRFAVPSGARTVRR